MGRGIPSGMVVHHINRDRTDDRVENLELLSSSDHVRKHRKEDAGWTVLRGERHGCAVLSENDVRSIRGLRPNLTYREIASMFGVHLSTVAYICRGKLWRHVA